MVILKNSDEQMFTQKVVVYAEKVNFPSSTSNCNASGLTSDKISAVLKYTRKIGSDYCVHNAISLERIFIL